jgi:quinohemoprotein ethanol dehydrogenase
MVRSLIILAGALLLSAPAPLPQEGAGDEWPSPGGDAGKTHYSRLADINRSNVAQLGLAWSYDLGTGRVQEATPVVIDGVMYTSGNLGRVYALDAATGRALWTFEPEVDMQVNRWACCDQANRGVAVRGDKLFVAALDGVLYALDRKTGQVAWKADTIDNRKRGYTITGAPEVAGDLVVIGNAGSDYDARGYVSAYQADTGKLAWRFFIVPRDPKLGPQDHPDLERALATWSPDSRWDVGGGGSPWDAINYDPRFDTVLVGTGNADPYPHSERSPADGDNLYTASLVAIDRKTGRLRWYVQETPKDSWDHDNVQPMILTDMTIDGQTRPVVIHAPKNGLMFVIDRETGKPLKANPIVYANWTRGLDPATGKVLVNPDADYAKLGPRIVFPGTTGARSWQPAAWDRGRGLYYGHVLDMGNLVFTTPGPQPLRERAINGDAVLVFNSDLVDALPTLPPPVRAAVEKLPELERVKARPFVSELRAIDPLTGKAKWSVPMDGWQDRGGVLATAGGLVFQGRLNGRLNVYDADTGKLLKSIETGSSILAAPMTYKVKGVQYVAVATGWGGGGWPFVPPYSAAYKRGNANRLLVFRLGGRPVPLPPLLPPLTVAPLPPPQAAGVTPATIEQGRGLFFQNCVICHSNQPRSITPDLRRMSKDTHDAFEQIVLDGLYVPAGMPRWDDLLKRDEARAIHAYLIDEQAKTRARELELKKRGLPLDTKSKAILSAY